MLIPNFAYPVEVSCHNISETGEPSSIHIGVVGAQLSPLTVTVSMPQSEILLE